MRSLKSDFKNKIYRKLPLNLYIILSSLYICVVWGKEMDLKGCEKAAPPLEVAFGAKRTKKKVIDATIETHI